MKLWIARDKKGYLSLCDVEPTENGFGYWETSGNEYEIDWRLFPGVTFKNSPQQVEIKLIENEKDM